MIVETVIFSLCYFHVYFLYSYVLLLFYYYCHYCYSLLRLLLLSFVRISHNIFFCGFCIDHDIFRLSHPGHCAPYGRRVSFASLTLWINKARDPSFTLQSTPLVSAHVNPFSTSLTTYLQFITCTNLLMICICFCIYICYHIITVRHLKVAVINTFTKKSLHRHNSIFTDLF